MNIELDRRWFAPGLARSAVLVLGGRGRGESRVGMLRGHVCRFVEEGALSCCPEGWSLELLVGCLVVRLAHYLLLVAIILPILGSRLLLRDGWIVFVILCWRVICARGRAGIRLKHRELHGRDRV